MTARPIPVLPSAAEVSFADAIVTDSATAAETGNIQLSTLPPEANTMQAMAKIRNAVESRKNPAIRQAGEIVFRSVMTDDKLCVPILADCRIKGKSTSEV